MMNYSLLLLLLTALFLCASGNTNPHTKAGKLRKLSGPVPVDVSSSKMLHRQMKSRITGIKRLFDHPVRPAVKHEPYWMQMLNEAESPKFRPVDYGTDPTGATDSTAAMIAAVQALLNCSRGFHTLAPPIMDLGGAKLDLGGGTYNISSPLVFPGYVGNFQIIDGTLRAGPKFNPNEFMINIGLVNCTTGGSQGVCNEYININEVFLDAGHTAAGGLQVHTQYHGCYRWTVCLRYGFQRCGDSY